MTIQAIGNDGRDLISGRIQKRRRNSVEQNPGASQRSRDQAFRSNLRGNDRRAPQRAPVDHDDFSRRHCTGRITCGIRNGRYHRSGRRGSDRHAPITCSQIHRSFAGVGSGRVLDRE